MPAFGRQRIVGLGVLSTGVVCPCHVLVCLAGLLLGGQVLTPAAQDGAHAVYVPLAVLAGAMLLGKRSVTAAARLPGDSRRNPTG
jgi:hypothetical protein